MSRFLSQLCIERASRAHYWRLVKPLQFVDDQGRLWEVPAGFETDGASVPRAFWRVIGHPFDSYFESAVIHDWLYGEAEVSRKESDRIFRVAMRSQRIPGWRRGIMWAAVRMFGFAHYGSCAWIAGIIAVLAVLCAGCMSSVTEMREGKPWTIETRSICGLKISRNEAPLPTAKERRIAQIEKMIPRGGWIITAGALLFTCGIAVAFWSKSTAIDDLAYGGAVVGIAAISAGMIMIGIAKVLTTWIIAIPVCMLVVFYIWKRKLKQQNKESHNEPA
jgi:hypothetical protein